MLSLSVIVTSSLIVCVVAASNCPASMTPFCEMECSDGVFHPPRAICCRLCLMTSQNICRSSFQKFKGHVVCDHSLASACAKSDDVADPIRYNGKCAICRELLAKPDSGLREVELSECKVN